MDTKTKIILGALALTPVVNVYACASCGCSLNTEWSSLGMSQQSGWSVDLRLDMLNQNQLRSGTSTISAQAAAATYNPTTAGPAEVEQYTNNQYLTPTIDYSDGNAWGVSFSVPLIGRDHSTLGTGSPDGVTPGSGAYQSGTYGFGDVRVVGRYFGFAEEKNFGIQFGLKLPTGNTTQVSNDGTNTPVDPGLQLGTGTTDLILGAYYLGNVNESWDYFLQAQYQTALAYGYVGGGSYKPGDSINFTGGVRYHGFESFIPELQLNVRNVQTDKGTAADLFSTGGTLVYLTPGVTVPVSDNLSVHANLQLPVFQNVNGIQLTPLYIFSVGARISF